MTPSGIGLECLFLGGDSVVVDSVLIQLCIRGFVCSSHFVFDVFLVCVFFL